MSQFTSKTSRDPLGQTLDQRFVLQSVLQRGGIGTLYLAQDLVENQQVALKTLRLQNLQPSAKALFRRFQREGKILSLFDHPCIVKVIAYDFFDQAIPYIAMEYIEGLTLREYLQKFPLGLPISRFLPLMKQLCSAVNRIHRLGYIHRDIKPNNMMVQIQGRRLRLKLLDFGLVLIERSIGPDATTKLTQKGQLLGTPAYMSPEQCRGEASTQESDIYNLGLIAYELLAGRPAIQATTVQKLINNQIEQMPVPIHEKRTDVPLGIGLAIQKAIQKFASKRFHTARSFFEALDKASQESRPH